MKKYFINVSGGGIKFIGLLSAFKALIDGGLIPKKVSGVSAGAIVNFLYFTNKLTEGMDIARKTHRISVIFSRLKNPTGPIGGLSIWALLLFPFRRKYLGEMDNLEKNMRRLVSKEHWYKILKETDVDCYIHCVDEETEERMSFNLRELDYEQAISVVIASASIAPIIKARKVVINGTKYSLVDGGHRDSSAGSFLLSEGIVKDFDECVTIWSRAHPNLYKSKTRKALKNFFERLIFVFSAYGRETSLNDEKIEKEICDELGKKHSSIYVNISNKGTYSITKDQIVVAEAKAKGLATNYLDTLD